VSAIAPFLIACGVIALVSIPLILKLVPPNRWYGFRTAQTLSDTELWFDANRFAGWALLAAATLSSAVFISLPELASSYGASVLVVSIAVAVALSFVHVRKWRASGRVQ
jgi:uncharacterized membrane protein